MKGVAAPGRTRSSAAPMVTAFHYRVRCRHKYSTHMHANSAFVSSWCGQCMCPHFRPWFIAPWPFLYPARDIYPDQ